MRVVDVVFGAAPILPTEMIPSTAFINKYVKSIEPERRRIFPRIGRLVPILALFTDDTTAYIGLAEVEEQKGEVICEASKMTMVPPNLEAVLKMKTKSARTFIKKAKRELAVRTCLLIAGGF